MLSEAVSAYLGTTFVKMWLLDVNWRHPATAEMAGAGGMFALVLGQGIFVHREAGAVLHAYVALTRPLDWFEAIDFSEPAIAKGQRSAWMIERLSS